MALPHMDLTYENFPERLRDQVAGFSAVYDQHVSDNDQVLPHVLLGDLVRFVEERVRAEGPESPPLRMVLDLMEAALGARDAKLRNLVMVSFLENVDLRDPTWSKIKLKFGPRLMAVTR
jgi:hypothetical protein